MIQVKMKHPLPVRLMHWLNVPVLSIMIWSGILIYWANDVYWIGWGETVLFKFFPASFYDALGVGYRLAEGMAWHFTFMWLFALNGLAYVLYNAFSGEWRDLVPDRQAFGEAFQVVLHDLRIRKTEPPKRGKFNGAQRIAYTGVITMGAGSVLTGLAIFRPVQLSWLTWMLGGYEWARLEHFVLTLGYVGFFLIHIAQVIKTGWNNFRAMVIGYEVVDSKEPRHE